MTHRHRFLSAVGVVLLAGAAIAAPPQRPLESTGKAGVDAGVPAGAVVWPEDLTAAIRGEERLIRLPHVALGGGFTATLELELASAVAESFQLVASRVVGTGPDRRIETRPLPAPDLVVRRGVAKDARGAILGEAWVAAGRTMIGGFVRLEHGMHYIAKPPANVRGPRLAFDPASVSASLIPTGEPFCQPMSPPPGDLGTPAGVSAPAAGFGGSQCFELAIAIETDREFTSTLFGGSLEAAGEYAVALMAASGEIFDLDLSVRLRTSFVRLWEGEDPWTQTQTGAQLVEYRDHWEAFMSEVPRDLGHFLSGRGLGGGVAWLPGICNGSFAYGLSANLNGSFPYPIINHSHDNWDIMVVSHELGHNFGAPHTHQVTPPIDGCGNGDCSEAFGGTIMSYCHICPGGLSNIVVRFHPGSIDSMLATLAGVSCDFAGGPDAVAAPDAASGLGWIPLQIDVLRNDSGGDCSAISIASHDAVTQAGHPVETFSGPDGRPWIMVSGSESAAGLDSFTYEIIDAFGGTDVADVTIEWVSLRPATPVSGTEVGVSVTHYAIPQSDVLPDFTTLVPLVAEVLPNIELPSTGGEFAGSGLADLVASAFTGWIDVPAAGIWSLHAESDDGSRLWIGDTLVVDNDGLHGMLERSGTVPLAAGRHPIRVEFFENFGGAGLLVRWTGPGTPKSVIPASAWSHGGSVITPDLDGDGTVGTNDLLLLLASWGACGGCPADLDGDGTVGTGDLLVLLAAWQSA